MTLDEFLALMIFSLLCLVWVWLNFEFTERPRPTNGCSSAKYGMISLSLIRPGLDQFVYRLIRLTSHFGCGHLELAYMDIDGGIEIYAVRNILKANISRLHFKPSFFILENNYKRR